ncbi:MAG: ornithine carbamoyltransferase [Candidatus Micrarchaeota archaeon]|nr:ornithine carbamoyltransferase [Candidatus Micrarchaeota archaeon]
MNFLSIWETSPAGIEQFLTLAADVKKNRAKYRQALSGQTLVMLFEKSSTRTRVSFDIAMHQMGGHALSLDWAESQMARGESVADTARVLGRYADAIMARMHLQEDLVELAKSAGVPVISGRTDEEHPCQALGDLLTMRERRVLGPGKKFCFIGDASRYMSNSLMLACAKAGMDITLVCPGSCRPQDKYIHETRKFAKVTHTDSPVEGVKGADVIYTDVWAEPGTEAENASRMASMTPYQVNAKLMEHAKDNAVVMHCLPAHRGLEITSEVMDGPSSAIWDQAENRLHVQKAILLKVLEKA